MTDKNNKQQCTSGEEYIQFSNSFDSKVNEVNKEKEYENIVREALKKQRAQGIRIGILAASKAIMEYVNDKSKPLMARIELIKKFCTVAMKDEQVFLNKDLYDTPEKTEETND